MLRFVTISIFFLILSIPVCAHDKYEVRATWLTTLGGMDWPSQKAISPKGIKRQQLELCEILDKLKKANFNTILFQTRLRGDVIYPSYLEGFAECLTGKTGRDPGYDPLQFAIDECHKRGMAIHAWVVAIPIGSKRQVKLLHRNSVVVKHPSICKLFKGNWYLDPGEPATADYLSHIIKEIVSRYDIDGVHFDYMRYPEQGKRFPDFRSYQKYGKKKPLDQWRRENINRIVKRLYTEIKDIKPWVIVSSSPIGKYNDTKHYRSYGWNAYQEVCQDAQKWLKEGIHDALFPMLYFRNNHFYPFALDWQEQKNNRWIVPGIGIYFLQTKSREWSLDEVIRQLHFTREYHFEGQSYFRNRFLMDNAQGIWSELDKNFYSTPSVTPPLTWIDSIAPAMPTLLTFEEKRVKDSLSKPTYGIQTHIKWKTSSTHKPGGIGYRIYASNTYPVNTNQGENIVATYVRDSCYTHTAPLPWQHKLYWAISAVDRYGNESKALTCNQPQAAALVLYDNQLPQIPQGNELIISDVTGKEVIRTNRSTHSVLNNLPPGIYQISLLNPEGIQKLIGTLVR